MNLNRMPWKDTVIRTGASSWRRTYSLVFVLCALLMGSIAVVAAWSDGSGLNPSTLCFVLGLSLAKAGLFTTVICSMD